MQHQLLVYSMLRLKDLTSFYEKTGDTFKLSKVDVRPLRQAEIGNLEPDVCYQMCVCTGGFWRAQSRSEVCVCVFWRCKCMSVWLCGKLSPVLRCVTLASCFCTLSEGKRRRCCFRWPFYHCLGLSLCAGRLPTGSILLWPLLFPTPQNTMSQSYTDATQWLNTPNVNSAVDKSQKPLAS